MQKCLLLFCFSVSIFSSDFDFIVSITGIKWVFARKNAPFIMLKSCRSQTDLHTAYFKCLTDILVLVVTYISSIDNNFIQSVELSFF